MAIAINKSIEVDGMGGLTFGYWKLANMNVNILQSNRVTVILVPFLNQSSDGPKSPAFAFSRTYEMTAVQAGLNTSQTGNQLRDTILAFILANEPDFSGGTLV